MNMKVSTWLTILGVLSTALVLCAVSVAAEADSEASAHGSEKVSHGKELYDRVCVACHGPQAQGNEALNAPRLAGQEPWYLSRQLKNFKEGIRGSDTRDIFGMQMRPMAMTLTGEADITAIVAYIGTLSDSAGQ